MKNLAVAAVFCGLVHVAFSQCSSACPDIYAPVCGSDGKTYANECELNYAKCLNKPDLEVAHQGHCSTTPIANTRDGKSCNSAMKNYCTREYNPVCGSNGITYPNLCLFCSQMYKDQENGKTLEINHQGECQPDDYCPQYSKYGICTLDYRPVCASDKNTYNNLCLMCATMYEKQSEGEDIVLKVVHDGVCKSPRKSKSFFCNEKFRSGVCTKEYRPLCADNGKTYSNRCTFCFAKFQAEDNGSNITVAHEGQCPKPKALTKNHADDIEIECKSQDNIGACTREYRPICGSDGQTYANRCMFCHAKAQKEENGDEKLTVKHLGACVHELICPESSKNGACPFNYDPVCSNENKTYSNECLLCAELYKRQANGENIHLHITHRGEC